MRRVGALRIAPAGSCHRVSTRVRDMSEITTREYRYVNLFFACPVDPARAHVNMSAHVTRIAVNRPIPVVPLTRYLVEGIRRIFE